MQENFSELEEVEQRYFYTDFLIKLIHSFTFKQSNFDYQACVQISAALNRIKMMVKSGFIDTTYPTFLRTQEACIDEILILLILARKNKPLHAKEASETIKDFVYECTRVKPEFATFRSSGMQAIWSAFMLVQDCISQIKELDDPKIFVDYNMYFEVSDILDKFLNLHYYENIRGALRIKMNIDASYIMDPQKDEIYDIYMGNFESNINVENGHLFFRDVEAFIDEQMQLRKDRHIENRPLFVILDNTISDFNDAFLSCLLQNNINEINNGSLCVFVAHSGNKYLSLGCDKELAALLYAYYNPIMFPRMDAILKREITDNQLGDFESNSATILLTEKFLTAGREHILKYSPMIRYRTESLFKNNIPIALCHSSNCISFDLPRTDQLDAPWLDNYCGFITIRFNYHKFIPS